MEEAAADRRLRSGALLFVVVLISTASAAAAAAAAAAASGVVGVNVKYPQLEVEQGKLPKAEHVVDLLNIIQVRHLKLGSDAHPSLLRALSGSGIQVLVTVPEQSIPALAQSRNAAADWLQSNVLGHFPSTEVTGVVLPAELLARDSDSDSDSDARDLVEAARKIHLCIAESGLESRVKVTVSVPMELFSDWSRKPSSAAFQGAYKSRIRDLLGLLAATNSFLMIDLDPFEAHLRDGLPLDFAMLSSTDHTLDGYSGLLDAAVDSAYSAIEKLGFANVSVVVGAIGWPWKSSSSSSPSSESESENESENETENASVENAARFSHNLVNRIQSGRGTPIHPEAAIAVYIHELFDVVGPADSGTSRRRYGLFSTSQIPRYSFHLSPEVSEAEILMRRVLADNGTNGTTGGTSTGGGQFCVARPGATDTQLSVGLNWACGQGNADCTPIQQNGACYLPDTYSSHASYAFNSYYQRNAASGATCDFQGAATLTSSDPSYNSCVYTSGSSGGGTGGGASGGGLGPSSSGGILQPFNPSSNTSDAVTVHAKATTVGTTFMLAVLVWSWRFFCSL